MKNIITSSILGVTALIFTGCGVSSTGPMVAGANNTFKITHSEGAFPTGSGVSMLEGATVEAQKYCKDKNLNMTTVHTGANTGPYILGKFPRGSITFTCINDKKLRENQLLVDTKDKTLTQTQNKVSSINVSDKLKALQQMYKDGLITKKEYDEKRKNIINNY